MWEAVAPTIRVALSTSGRGTLCGFGPRLGKDPLLKETSGARTRERDRLPGSNCRKRGKGHSITFDSAKGSTIFNSDREIRVRPIRSSIAKEQPRDSLQITENVAKQMGSSSMHEGTTAFREREKALGHPALTSVQRERAWACIALQCVHPFSETPNPSDGTPNPCEACEAYGMQGLFNETLLGVGPCPSDGTGLGLHCFAMRASVQRNALGRGPLPL
jgi:hypothetical protein